MAKMAGMVYSAEQVEALACACKMYPTEISAQLEQAQSVFNQLKGEEIIVESAVKEPIIEAITAFEATTAKMAEKLDLFNKWVEDVLSTMNYAVKVNVSNSSEAAENLHAAAKKAAEVKGTV